jgi:two-component system, chemotaxis family, CheB/CheR fusion protein
MRLLGIKILLVEDDIDNLELLASFLDGEGAQTLSASSISAALAQTVGQRVHVVLSDLELPDGDGCALLAALKKRNDNTAVPAIAVTGYSDQKWRDKAANCGFDRYAVKPFSLEQLVAWIVELSVRPQNVANAEFCHGVPLQAARDRLAR